MEPSAENAQVSIGGESGSLVTIETSRPGDAYTLFKSGVHLDVHLAGPGKTGGTGAIVCGFDRFAEKVGFSVGGGVSGPGYVHHPCPECASLVNGRSVIGMHARRFSSDPERDGGAS